MFKCYGNSILNLKNIYTGNSCSNKVVRVVFYGDVLNAIMYK